MMRRSFAIAGSIVADALRRKIVWVVILFAALMAIAIPSLPSYGTGVIDAVYREVALALIYVASLVVMLSLAASRVPSEIERRTLYAVLSRDVRRWEYILGTWLGVFLVMGGVIAAFCVITQIVGYAVYGSLMWRLWQGALSIWLETGIIAAFAIAVSCVAGTVIVAVSSLGFIFVTHAREGLLGGSDNAFWSFYPSLDTFNIINPVAHGSGVDATYVLVMLGVFVAWVAVILLVGSTVFETRDV
ncbi:MAG: hypothetical protein PF636_02985 [Actinomycetota bacterium]|jgi:ABC-type transport system involved in multi-copper enzyme maturation permease subunit|nr:hypothetical protein [Actinomycetota bacterium]